MNRDDYAKKTSLRPTIGTPIEAEIYPDDTRGTTGTTVVKSRPLSQKEDRILQRICREIRGLQAVAELLHECGMEDWQANTALRQAETIVSRPANYPIQHTKPVR